MATSSVKQEVIRARISRDQKEKFKKIADKKGKTITEMLCSYIEKEIELHEFEVDYKEEIEDRIKRTDKKLFDLKSKLKWSSRND